MSVETRAGAILTGDQRRKWDQDGYLILDDPCPIELIDTIAAEFDHRFHDDSHPGPEHIDNGVFYYAHDAGANAGYHWQRIMDAWRISDAARALALAPRVLATISELYGRAPLPFQTLNFPVGTQQPAHSDSMHFSSDPPGIMCGVWVALEDMDMENGPLVYYPGSQKLPTPSWAVIEQEMGSVPRRDDFETYPEYIRERGRQYVAYCRHLIDKHDLQPEYGTIRKGQAMVWSSNLLHGGAVQRDMSRTRHSQVTHYFFEGVRVYTPMRSEGDYHSWQYPTWIRDPVPQYGTDFLHESIRANVPEGAGVLVATTSQEEADVGGVRARQFPLAPDGSAYDGREVAERELIEELERLRGEGADYIVFPRTHLWTLGYRLTDLQQRLENGYRGVLRDGAVAAIYALD